MHAFDNVLHKHHESHSGWNDSVGTCKEAKHVDQRVIVTIFTSFKISLTHAENSQSSGDLNPWQTCILHRVSEPHSLLAIYVTSCFRHRINDIIN